MPTDYFATFSPVIRVLSHADLNHSPTLRSRLRIAVEGDLEVCYAPLEYVNPQARVVLVGITPGMTQMVNSVTELRLQLAAGADRDAALRAAKLTGAFSGVMRPNLVELLDSVGLQRALGIPTCADLFGSSSEMVQTTSVLRNPVFLRGGNYNGTPNMTAHRLLRTQLIEHFARDLVALPHAMLVPLGDRVAQALHWLASEGVIERDRILDGLPHPSGANSERIAYFVGRKARTTLSAKTNPATLDRARARLVERVGSVRPSQVLTQIVR
jgi:hypothetical protein